MLIAILLFGLSAVGGVAMAGMRLQGRSLPPMGLALVHGAAAAAALLFLLVQVFTTEAGARASLAAGLFVVVALGGFALFSFHLRKKALPLGLLGIHGGLAVVAFALLLFTAL